MTVQSLGFGPPPEGVKQLVAPGRIVKPKHKKLWQSIHKALRKHSWGQFVSAAGQDGVWGAPAGQPWAVFRTV